MIDLSQYLSDAEDSGTEVLELILRFHGIDGAHHKDWLIDQITRKVTGENYEKFIMFYTYETHDPDEIAARIVDGDYYSWDEGIAP